MPNNDKHSLPIAKTQGQDKGIVSSMTNTLATALDDSSSGNSTSGRGNQGFASMSKDKQREIASKGGKAAHAQGTAHEWDSSEAAAAGRRGGKSRTSNGR